MAKDAAAFALVLLRADTTADGGKSRVLRDDFGGEGKVFVGHGGDEVGNLDAHRALGDAHRFLAVQTAACLGHGLLGSEAEGDFVEVGGTHSGVLFTWLLTLDGRGDGGAEVAAVSIVLVDGGYTVAALVGAFQTACSLFEVDKMSVEFGTVDASELHLVAHGHAAGSAHAGAVNHHAVHAHDGLEAKLLGQEGDEFHHGQGADGHAVGISDGVGLWLS